MLDNDEREARQIAPGMDVCDVSGEKVGTVAHVHHRPAVREVIEVKTGPLGLGKHLYPVRNPSEAERMAIVATGGYGRGVLGPGSDAAHALHLHFDMALRRGGYRLCDLGAPTVALTPENTKRE